MAGSPHQIEAVVERPESGRFEMAFTGGVAFATFHRDGQNLIVTHTEVPSAYGGQGLGSRLAEGIFRHARASGRRIVPACSFIADWARCHPEFADVVASRR